MSELSELLEKVKELNAGRKFKEVIDLLPDDILESHQNADLYAEKSRTHYKLKNFELSKLYSDKSLELDPSNIKGLRWRAALLTENKEYEEAKNIYKEIIERDNNYESAYNGLGIVHVKLKEYDEAIHNYNRAIDINSKYIAAYFNKAILYYTIEDYSESIKVFKKVIELDNEYLDAHYILADVYTKTDDVENAINEFNIYLSLDLSNESNFFIEYAKARIKELKRKNESSSYSFINDLVSDIKEILLFEKNYSTHYTSLSTTNALILQNSPFRLSEGSFMNDTSEGKELFKFLVIQNYDEPVITSGAELFSQKPFIGSFVDNIKNDDLTMWRMYGKEEGVEAKGCAITLNVSQLIRNINVKLIPLEGKESIEISEQEDYQFFHVAYCKLDTEKTKFVVPGLKPKKVARLNKSMNDLLNAVSIFIVNDGKNKEGIRNIKELLNEIAYLFKSIDYQHEQEVRLVIKGIGFEKKIKEVDNKDPDDNRKIMSPKVYIETLPIREFISEITIGPKVERAEEWAAAFYYNLKKDDLTPEILISKLPFK